VRDGVDQCARVQKGVKLAETGCKPYLFPMLRQQLAETVRKVRISGNYTSEQEYPRLSRMSKTIGYSPRDQHCSHRWDRQSSFVRLRTRVKDRMKNRSNPKVNQ